jgi:hypothetical protein
VISYTDTDVPLAEERIQIMLRFNDQDDDIVVSAYRLPDVFIGD